MHEPALQIDLIPAQRAEFRRPPYRRAYAYSTPHFPPRVVGRMVYSSHMAKRTTLDGLATLVSKGFASADKKFTALAEDITEIKNTMATKEELAKLRRETTEGFAAVSAEMATKDDISGIRSELSDIKGRLKAVEAAVKNHAGHSKEIDHALERIAAIERHLGINKKIAA